MGLIKNLTEDEICAQAVHSHWKTKPDSIAFMGMGEPLANPRFFNALYVLTQNEYGGFSQRRISVSTVGYAPGLERLTREYPQINITLSVHSPFPEQRGELIPLEKQFSLKENIEILNHYTKMSRRKVYLAYLLIKNVNDSSTHLKALASLVHGCTRPELFHISVIGYNNAGGISASYQSPQMAEVMDFVSKLRLRNIHATKRQQFGSLINAACGQLHTN